MVTVQTSVSRETAGTRPGSLAPQAGITPLIQQASLQYSTNDVSRSIMPDNGDILLCPTNNLPFSRLSLQFRRNIHQKVHFCYTMVLAWDE